MNAAQRAAHLRDKLIEKGDPFLDAELLLEIGSPSGWPLVQVWDDTLESLILIAVVDQDRQLIDALGYAVPSRIRVSSARSPSAMPSAITPGSASLIPHRIWRSTWPTSWRCHYER